MLHSTSFRPCTTGLKYAYVGSALQTISRPLPPPSPAPPSPQPSATIAFTVQLSTNIVSNSASFGGKSSLTQLHSLEQDTTALQTTEVLSDQFVSCPGSGSGNYLEAGWSSLDSNGVLLKLVYGSGDGLVDELPETPGASWTNNAALTLSETDPDGQTSVKTVNADGSYKETVNFPDGTVANATENSDGSATYSAPVGGPNAGGNTVVSIGTPNPSASGGPAIPILITAPSSTPQPISVADWYPPGPLTLASETDQDVGSGAFPAACNVPASVASSGNKIVRTLSRFDTIFGELEHDVQTTYTAAGIGVVCVVINNSLTAYYDYTGQGPNFSPVPQQITTLAETIGLQTVSGASYARHALSSQSIPARVTAAQQRFIRLVRRHHAAAIAAWHRASPRVKTP